MDTTSDAWSGTYWVTDGDYHSAFLATPDGVMLFDAPPSIGRGGQLREARLITARRPAGRRASEAWHARLAVAPRCGYSVLAWCRLRGRHRLISAKIPDPAVQSPGHLPQREAVTIVADVATGTAINADDVNQVLGDLRYAKVSLMGISSGMAVEQAFSRRYPCAGCRSGPAARRTARPERAHSLTFPPSPAESTVYDPPI